MNAENPQSILFADVLGRSRLQEKLGSSETRRAVNRCLKRVQRAVEAYGGRTVKSVDDELIATFGLADDAFHAAIDMQQRVADLPPVSGIKLAVGVSFSHGPVSETEAGVAGETVQVAACLAKLAKPGQILTSSQAQAALSPPLQRATRDLTPAAPAGRSPPMRIFEVVAADAASRFDPIDSLVDEVAELQGSRLHVRYAGESVILDAATPSIRLGRGVENTLVINDRRASRHHATIERRGWRIVVIDTSTNGTYVTLNGKPELLLRSGECVIHGKGTICFAASGSGSAADCAEFEEF